MAYLEFEHVQDPAVQVVYPIRREVVRIGRAQDCECRVKVPSVSRHHASLSRVDGGWVIKDEGSRNGVIINGRRVEAPARLRNRDRLTLGVVRAVFRTEKGESAGDTQMNVPPVTPPVATP